MAYGYVHQDPLWLILVSYFTLVLDVGEYEDYDRRGPMSPPAVPGMLLQCELLEH